MLKRNFYVEPTISVVRLEEEDVVRTSGTGVSYNANWRSGMMQESGGQNSQE